MNTTHPKFEQDWEKAVLLACLVASEVPPWAEGKNMPKALAALCGWGENRALNAFKEAARRGMLTEGPADESSSFAN
jgi:hypothetical protein